MGSDSILILVVLTVMVGLFFWGRWRHDVVAFGALLVCVLTGLVPAGDAFAGFGPWHRVVDEYVQQPEQSGIFDFTAKLVF